MVWSVVGTTLDSVGVGRYGVQILLLITYLICALKYL